MRLMYILVTIEPKKTLYKDFFPHFIVKKKQHVIYFCIYEMLFCVCVDFFTKSYNS